MALKSKGAKHYHSHPRAEGRSKQQAKGLYLAISCAADVSDPAARTASVWQRIKDTTAAHWGVGTVQRPWHPVLMGARKPICHHATVWFAY